MSIIDKLGITPISVYDAGGCVPSYKVCLLRDVEELEQQRNELLEGLIDIATGKKMHVHIRSDIEKVAKMTWQEIKELL